MLSPIEEIIAEAKQGKMFVLVDDPNRENEGDLIIPAEFADANAINFMATHGRGLICLTITSEQAKKLKLNLVNQHSSSNFKTAFTHSIEAAHGITTGISAFDRAHTIATAINPHANPQDIISPGHTFPIIAQDGGVLVRAGHTEASVDISKIAGLNPSSVICEIMNEDGTMARMPDLIKFAEKHQLKIGTIADLIAYRRRFEKLITKINETTLSTKYGEFRAVIYRNNIDGIEHIVLIKGDIVPTQPTLVRMHSISILNDIIGDMAEQKHHTVEQALKIIAKENGVMVFIRDLKNNYFSYNFSNHENSNKDNHLRNYGIGAQILIDLGIKNMTLLSNNQKIVTALEGFDINLCGYRNMES